MSMSRNFAHARNAHVHTVVHELRQTFRSGVKPVQHFSDYAELDSARNQNEKGATYY